MHVKQNKSALTVMYLHTCQARDRISSRERGEKRGLPRFLAKYLPKTAFPFFFFFSRSQSPRAELTFGATETHGKGGGEKATREILDKQNSHARTWDYLQTKRWRGGGGRTWRGSI